MLRDAGAEAVEAAVAAAGGVPGFELHPSERELVRKLLTFPAELTEAADRRAPHRVATYAHELARTLSAFYRDCPVLKEEREDLRAFRLTLCLATQRTLSRSLGLLGVSAPESM
jgi:arginyl-tRNA synthetase